MTLIVMSFTAATYEFWISSGYKIKLLTIELTSRWHNQLQLTLTNIAFKLTNVMIVCCNTDSGIFGRKRRLKVCNRECQCSRDY